MGFKLNCSHRIERAHMKNRNSTPFIKLSSIFMTCSLGFALLFQSGPAIAGVTSVTIQSNLAFGSIAGNGTSSGTASLTASTSPTLTLSSGLTNFGGTISAARFRVQGTNGYVVTITLPSSFSITVGGKTMTVTNLTHDCPAPCTLPPSGRATINVGGTLNLSPNQGSGAYTGNLLASFN